MTTIPENEMTTPFSHPRILADDDIQGHGVGVCHNRAEEFWDVLLILLYIHFAQKFLRQILM